jgi:acetylornithine deacetylase/succinyl-diaminopimelate desuccinylase-like protein
LKENIKMDNATKFIVSNLDRYIAELFSLIRLPSVSPEGLGMESCAQLVWKMLKQLGANAQVFETALYPIVLGSIYSPGAEKTLLIYGHYDVQPAGDLSLWTSPPFEPTIREGRIYGRGVADNKGQFFALMKAVESVLCIHGKLPCNVIFLLDGEEEVNSPSLEPFIDTHKELLGADACLVSDGPRHESGRPTIVCGLKGLIELELRVKGANRDMHSMRAAMFPSPVWRLIHVLASLKGPDGRVAIPGFYDAVRMPTRVELEAIERIPVDAGAIRRELEVREILNGDGAYYHNMCFSPTCNISGIESGYTGIGSSTVLPAGAFAKLDLRLVPDQKPKQILEQLELHLRNQGCGDMEIETYGDLTPSRTPIDHPYVQLVAGAVCDATGKTPIIYPSMGGSGPDYLFTKNLGLPSVWLPLASHDSNNHAANENMAIEDLLTGIRMGVSVIESFGRR